MPASIQATENRPLIQCQVNIGAPFGQGQYWVDGFIVDRRFAGKSKLGFWDTAGILFTGVDVSYGFFGLRETIGLLEDERLMEQLGPKGRESIEELIAFRVGNFGFGRIASKLVP